MSEVRVTRNLVVQRWGTPHVTVGSVNEPREMEEHGHRFNEKWVYRLLQPEPSQAKERVLYWLRYDLVGSLLVNGDGTTAPEDLSRQLADVTDRLYHPSESGRSG
jgi:hypothetical protein